MSPAEYAFATAVLLVLLVIALAVIVWLVRQNDDEMQRELDKANQDYYRRQRLMAGPLPTPKWPSADAMPVQSLREPEAEPARKLAGY